MFSSIIPHLAHELYNRVSTFGSVQQNNQSCSQTALREEQVVGDPSQIQEEPMTEIHGPLDVKTIAMSQLLTMVMVSQHAIMTKSLKEVHGSIKKDAQVMKAIDETLGELAEVSVSDDSVTVQNKPDLQEKLKKLESLGFTSQLIKKETLTKKERDSLQLHLQHKRSTLQEDIKMKRQEFSEINEKRNNLYQTFISLIATIKQSIDRIFSAAK